MDIEPFPSSPVKMLSKKDLANLAREYRRRFASVQDQIRRSILKRPGLNVAPRRSAAVDKVLISLYDRLVQAVDPQERYSSTISLIAQGGYGREELDYYSDIDLLIILPENADHETRSFVKSLLYILWDSKTDIGYGVKTIKEAMSCFGQDIKSVTALIEYRHLAGSRSLIDTLDREMRRRFDTRLQRWFVSERLAARETRHNQFGATIRLLEPNIKESEGGLRDVHNIQWFGYALFGTPQLEELVAQDILESTDVPLLKRALNFLHSVRNHLHLSAGRKTDILTFQRQHDVARAMTFTMDEKFLPEEKLMRRYYQSARVIVNVTERAITRMAAAKPTLFPRRYTFIPQEEKTIDTLFILRGKALFIDDHYRDAFISEFTHFLRIFQIANEHGVRLSEETKHLIYTHRKSLRKRFVTSPEQAKIFLTLLSCPNNLYRTLVDMHDCGVLDRFIPEFGAINCLVRIDFYHKYTVDEHLLRAMAVAEVVMKHGRTTFSPEVDVIAKRIARWDVLNLAILLHDIGKGEGHGHVLKGAQIVSRVAARIGVGSSEQELIRKLVLEHLKLSHTAFRRDLESPGVIEDMAREMGTTSFLDNLFILTLCDTSAIAPDAWTTWKEQLLLELHRKVRNVLEGQPVESVALEKVSEERLTHISLALIDAHVSENRTHTFIDNAPRHYLLITPSEKIVHDYHTLRKLNEKKRVKIEISPYSDGALSEVFVYTYDVPGVFSKLCAALSSKEINILSAHIFSTKDGFALDTFRVTDLEGNHLPAGLNFSITERNLNDVLLGKKAIDVFLKNAAPIDSLVESRMHTIPTRIIFDNESSQTHTIIEVNTADRPWLLYSITAAMARENLNIDSAFITTEAYRVVDVFYVTDLENNKIDDPKRIRQIKMRIKDSLKQYSKSEAPIGNIA